VSSHKTELRKNAVDSISRPVRQSPTPVIGVSEPIAVAGTKRETMVDQPSKKRFAKFKADWWSHFHDQLGILLVATGFIGVAK
jgi:hypothetical protein